MRKFLCNILSIFVLFLLCSCSGGGKASSSPDEKIDTIPLKYSTLLTLTRHTSPSGSYVKAEIANPWSKGKILHTYILVKEGEKAPANADGATLVHTPLRRAVGGTNMHAALFEMLDAKDALAGVCEPEHIHLPWIHEGVKSGRIANCGSGLNPTIEAVLDLGPDALFLSPFQNSGGYGKVEGLGTPIIEVADYMESGPLARAEWIRFYGLLLGREEMADSLFAASENEYLRLSNLAAKSGKGKTLLMNKMMGTSWYVAEAQSPVGILLKDANAGNPWADRKGTGSVALPFETVADRGANADAWLFHYEASSPITKSDILAENSRYDIIRALHTGEVYASNIASNQYYELTAFQPHLQLFDLVTISHPELRLGAPRFFIKVK